MKRILTLALVGILTACGSADLQPQAPDPASPPAPPPAGPYPQGPDIDINGSFLGRVSNQGRSALLDVAIAEKDNRVNATMYVQDTKETLQQSGTRSLFKGSPVKIDLHKLTTDPSSPCPGKLVEEYLVQAGFDDPNTATGFVRRTQCIDGRIQEVDGGSLELVRR